MEKAVAHLLTLNKRDILVVAHSMSIHLLCGHLSNNPNVYIWNAENRPPPNCSYAELKFDSTGKLQSVSKYHYEHMEGVMANESKKKKREEDEIKKESNR